MTVDNEAPPHAAGLHRNALKCACFLFALGRFLLPLQAQEGQRGAETSTPPSPRVKLEALKRVPVPRGGTFPWANAKPNHETPKKVEGQEQKEELKLSGDDLVIQGFGKFSMATTGAGKEQLQEIILNDRVEIESKKSNFFLRGNQIKAVLDAGDGILQFVEANEGVQFGLDDLMAKGQHLRYAMETFGPRNRVRETVTIEGHKEKQKPATLWSGDNIIQSYRFVLDLRLNIYRAQGGAYAIIRLPGSKDAKGAAPASPAAESTTPESIALPNLDLSGGGTILFACDGDLLLEGATGMLRISRNVYIKRGALVVRADEVTVQLGGGAAGAGGLGGNIFAGQFEKFTSDGKVEIMTADFVVHCDHITNDLAGDIVRIEMSELDQEVRMYQREPGNPEYTRQYLAAKHRISFNPRTQAIVDASNQLPIARLRTQSVPPDPQSKAPGMQKIPAIRAPQLPRLFILNTEENNP